ncbi:hypothetical protein D0Y65_047483 [Glycine soja]|uniref:Uncharacterized protein n=1 Tax=Glycine soja TaxID=3848 RepID=A0A445FNX8_GLYSO|nr:hypothetical protein D0Y65_047483 [Glycine soja]
MSCICVGGSSIHVTLSTSWKPSRAKGCAIGLLMGDKSSNVNVLVELDTPVKNCLNIFGLERSDLNKSTGKSIPYLKLRELPDESFKILCPNIVEKQEELFKGLEQQLSGFASNVGKCKIGKNAVANQGVNNVVAKSESSDQQDCIGLCRDIVIDLLRGSGPKAKLKKAEILEHT